MNEHHIKVQRTARYVTLGSGPPPREVWLCCHGYGQLARFFARHFEPLAGDGRLIVVPEAMNRFYLENPGGDHRDARVGATWMTREDRLTEIDDYIGYLDAVLADAVPPDALRSARITALGFSQGVATVCRWTVRGAHAPRRLILWGEKLPPDTEWPAATPRFKSLDLVRVAGRDDPAVPADALARDGATLDAQGIRHRMIVF